MLFGCCTPIKYYSEIKKLGYDYIELSCRELTSLSDDAFHAFLAVYHDTALPCLALNDFCGPPFALAGPDYDLPALQDYLTILFRRASALGVRSIGIGAPASRRLPEHYPLELAESQFCQFLSIASEMAAGYQTEILLEALHAGVCNYINHTKSAVRIIQKMQKNNLFLLLDYYHAFNMQESLDVFSSAMPFVHHLHISSLSLSGSRGFLTTDDYPLLLKYLKHAKDTGYNRTFSIEPSPSLIRSDQAAETLTMFRRADMV